MTPRQRRFLLVGLTAVTALSLWRAFSAEGQRRRLAASYEQAQQALHHLDDELQEARQTIEQQTGDLAGLQQELQTLQAQLAQTTAEFASLQRQQDELRLTNVSLTTQLDSVTAEKEQLAAKFSSIRELKLAIRELKRTMRQQWWAAWRARMQRQQATDEEALTPGNRGYVVSHGVSTLGSGTRLHVHVLEPQSPN